MIYAKYFVLCSLALAHAKKHLDLNNYSFETFVSDFGHSFTEEEIPMRRNLFEAELKRVKAHNTAKKSWSETINKYSALSASEKSSIRGRNKAMDRSHVPLHEKSLPSDFKLMRVEDLPLSVDWRNQPNVVSSVKDQGYCGSCWAFAATATLESHVALSTGLLYDLSPQQLAMCSPNPDSCGGTGGCGGATAEIAYDYLAGSRGAVQEYEVSYEAYYGQNADCGVTAKNAPVATISSYTKLPENNYTALMNAVATVGPIAISVDASRWGAYSSGIFDGCNQENPDIDHAVVLVGYGSDNGRDYWTVRNSWSPSWGEIGYIRVLRTEDEENRCGMDTNPQDGTACAGDDEPKRVCGTCGILYDSCYPTDATLV